MDGPSVAKFTSQAGCIVRAQLASRQALKTAWVLLAMIPALPKPTPASLRQANHESNFMQRFLPCCLSLALALALVASFAEAELEVATAQTAPIDQPAQLGQPQQAGAQSGLAAPPFQLSPVEQQFVDQILEMWEDSSSKIKTFDCRFERWEYDPVFGPSADIPMIKSQGQLTYSKPDKGSFKILRSKRFFATNRAILRQRPNLRIGYCRNTKSASIGSAMAKQSSSTSTTKSSSSFSLCHPRCAASRSSMVRCRSCLVPKRKN